MILVVIMEINYEGCGKNLKIERYILNVVFKVFWIMIMMLCGSNCDVIMQCIVELENEKERMMSMYIILINFYFCVIKINVLNNIL